MLRVQKIWLFLLGLLFALALLATYRDAILCRLNYLPILDTITFQKECFVPTVIPDQDQNNNGIPDSMDLVYGARAEVTGRTRYDSSYYKDGYPPEGRGSEADVIWRAFRAAGYNLKYMVDADIYAVPFTYDFTEYGTDLNMDFRRVTNLSVFFQHRALMLTRDVRPGDASNLVQWQPGDIVVFGAPTEHLGIISDRRRKDGVPLVIHNAGPWATEGDYLLRWSSKIVYHFRFITD
jgi:uncharacterized protein YijF (DUF1287 family)